MPLSQVRAILHDQHTAPPRHWPACYLTTAQRDPPSTPAPCPPIRQRQEPKWTERKRQSALNDTGDASASRVLARFRVPVGGLDNALPPREVGVRPNLTARRCSAAVWLDAL